MSLPLHQLNPNQLAAVQHTKGPLLILAGAGSGKTKTMAFRIAHLITQYHVPTSAILGLSFTNKAAKELKERVTSLLPHPRLGKGLRVSTFHSLCVRILRTHGQAVGFQPNFTILSENDQQDTLKQLLRQIHYDDRKFDLGVILSEISLAKNRFLNPDQAQDYFLQNSRLGQDYQTVIAVVYPQYLKQLRILNAMDFDDLIYYTVLLLETNAEIRAHYNREIRYILVDEYQDTNPAQFKVLKLLTESHQNLCVVGDDDQSIYSWRGADPTHILEFSKRFEGTQTITLDQNYRSTNRILEAAFHVIDKNRNRFPKRLWSDRGEGEAIQTVVVDDDRAEADFVADEILRHSFEHKTPWGDCAVLYRSNSQSRVFEEAFRRNKIPYKIVGGLSFLERKEVKDVLGYWRLVANHQDDPSFRRIMNWPARGLGKTTLEALHDEAFSKQIPLMDALPPSLSPKVVENLKSFKAVFPSMAQELTGMAADPALIADWARRSLDRFQLKEAVQKDAEDPLQAARKWENVEELVHSLGQMDVSEKELFPDGLAVLREFLNQMSLGPADDKKDKQDDSKNQVTLMTLHGAKGLEFKIVFLVGMEEGLIPHKRTLDEATDLSEERRLCYVGITRAKDTLYLTRTKNRIRYGKPLPRLPSRFLEEIPKDLLVLVHRATEPDLSSEASREAHEVKVKNFLAEIRGRLAGNT